MIQGKLEVVKQEKTRVNVDILGQQTQTVTNPGSEGMQKQRETVPVPPPGIDITTKPFEFFCLKEGPQPGG